MTDVARREPLLARVVRPGKRLAGRAVPPNRRVKGLGGARGRRRLQLRKLLAPLFQRPVILTTTSGLRLRIGTDPVDELVAQHVLGPNRRDYFPDWRGPLPARPCILDLGAHHGFYAVSALHEYPNSRIICVEPGAVARESLRTNLRINGFESRARIVDVALAAERGESALLHAPDGSWGYSLHEDPSTATGQETVRLATLGDILLDDRPDIVKCNAEGAEFSLFEQLEAGDVRPVFMVVMIHPQFGDMKRLLAQAERMGYDVVRIGTPDRPAFHLWLSTETAP